MIPRAGCKSLVIFYLVLDEEAASQIVIQWRNDVSIHRRSSPPAAAGAVFLPTVSVLLMLNSCLSGALNRVMWSQRGSPQEAAAERPVRRPSKLRDFVMDENVLAWLDRERV